MTVLHSDILMLRSLPQALKSFQPAHGAKLKVVSNIPYNITSGEGHLSHLNINAKALGGVFAMDTELWPLCVQTC